MLILAFDTSITGCSVCISDGRDVWTDAMQTERGQAEMLVPMIDGVLKKSGYDYKDINRIAVTTGPGSFTGVRVGLSTAKALALSLDRPLFGISTLDVLSRGKEISEPTLFLIDTKRGDFYGQVFDTNLSPVDTAKIWSREDIEKNELTKIYDAVPDVKVLALMAGEIKTDTADYDPAHAPQPIYLRGAEVSQSKRLIPKIVKNLDTGSEKV